MKADFEYRGYVLSRFGSEFIARPVDPDEGAPEIVTATLGSLVTRVDELWTATGTGRPPSWIKQWLRNPNLTCLYPDVMMTKQRQLRRRIRLAVSALVVGGMVATGASADAIDFDRDGQLSPIDLHALVTLVTTGSLSRTAHVAIDGVHYDMVIRYTPRTDVDAEIVALIPETDDNRHPKVKRHR